jgi:hypothetical protein
MLLVPIPWAGPVWARPFFSVLAPSERYHQERGLYHKKLTDWARQMLLQTRRWLPKQPLVIVADRSFLVRGPHGPAPLPDHSLALGRRPVPTSATATGAPEWPATAQRCSLAHPGSVAGTP